MSETTRQWIVLIVQWVVFSGFSLAFLVGATYNGLIAYRELWEKNSDGSSFAPLIFGIIGALAVLSAPFGELSERLPYLWLPLVIDCGTGPYFVLVILYVIRDRKR
jgi:uncharacterized membrane protein YeaQ/YmgE (transglycosylase-associated protein family)